MNDDFPRQAMEKMEFWNGLARRHDDILALKEDTIRL
jgi:hypothetical protein